VLLTIVHIGTRRNNVVLPRFFARSPDWRSVWAVGSPRMLGRGRSVSPLRRASERNEGDANIYFSGYKLLVASGPYLKNTTNYSTAMTFSFTPDAKLINVKIKLDLELNMSKKFKPCIKKLRACLISRKRPNGHQVVTNEQSFLK
jgi:hypothetical protein